MMSMVDCVCLLVDAQDNPMPQTRFVTQKRSSVACALSWLSTKLTAPAHARLVLDEVFDLF